MNIYVYCYGNPVVLIDRNGHSVDDVLEQLKINAVAIVVGGSIYMVTTTADGIIKLVKTVAGNTTITGGDLEEHVDRHWHIKRPDESVYGPGFLENTEWEDFINGSSSEYK